MNRNYKLIAGGIASSALVFATSVYFAYNVGFNNGRNIQKNKDDTRLIGTISSSIEDLPQEILVGTVERERQYEHARMDADKDRVREEFSKSLHYEEKTRRNQ